jgi:CDP-diacylglycerol---glycerol-3-phosphate 3-phosphatidyltransferase
MNGLYHFKAWYAVRLTPVRRAMVTHHVPPAAITLAGVVSGAAAGAAIALLHRGPLAGAVVAALLALRLACANLDGGVARESGRCTVFGCVLNELGDRGAELAALTGCLLVAPAWLVLAAALGGTLPSWAALAGAAAGVDRVQGGPVGKTERCLLLVVAAATGLFAPVLAVFAIGSALTAVVRLARIAVLAGAS